MDWIISYFCVAGLVIDTFYSFFPSPYLPPLLEVERTSIALNADDLR